MKAGVESFILYCSEAVWSRSRENLSHDDFIREAGQEPQRGGGPCPDKVSAQVSSEYDWSSQASSAEGLQGL